MVVKIISNHGILGKIQKHERDHKAAFDLASSTEESTRDQDREATFMELGKKRFKHYLLLEPIMCEHSNIAPAFSSGDIIHVKL